MPTRRDRQPLTFGTTRLEAFSDGVFAIAITLLVLELEVPDAPSGSLSHALAAEWPSYLAYLISFATIGAAWIAHQAITEHVERADAGFLRLNLLVLLAISFVPFPTKVVAARIHEEAAERVAVSLYGAVLLASALLMAVLWRYARRRALVREDVDDATVDALSRRLEPGVVGYVLVIVGSYLAPRVALVGYLVLAVFLLLPTRRPASS